MPVAVRRKLAEAGVQLLEAQWRRLPLVARRRLLELPAETPVERASFGQFVQWLKRTFLGLDEPTVPTPVSGAEPPWRSEAPPPIVEMQPATWCGLGLDARFALVTAESEEERQRILAALTGAVRSL